MSVARAVVTVLAGAVAGAAGCAHAQAPIEHPRNTGDVRFRAILDLSYDPTEPALLGARVANPREFPASFYSVDDGGKCTSTLVGPRVLLTAAHCVGDGSRAALSIGDSSYQSVCSHPQQYPRNSTADWALCLVDRPITRIPYERVNTNAALFAKGDSLLLSGFGCTTPDGKGDGIYRIGEAPVRQLPAGTNNDLMTVGSVAVCYGDSGGPAFAYTDEVHLDRVQVSVNSRSNLRDVSLLSSLSTPQAIAFITAWMQNTKAVICGISNDVDGCRHP